MKQFAVLQSCSRHHTQLLEEQWENQSSINLPAQADPTEFGSLPWRSTRRKELMSRERLGNCKCNTSKNLHSVNVPDLPFIFSSSESILLQPINPHCIRKVVICYSLGANWEPRSQTSQCTTKHSAEAGDQVHSVTGAGVWR